MQIILHEELNHAALQDEQVFKELYREYFVKLYRFAVSLVHCREAAEEIVHDVLINLWKKRSAFHEIENLNTYLFVSVKNLSLNYLRSQRNRVYVDEEVLYDKAAYCSVDPESVLISKEKVEALDGLINNLPVKCKLIFKLIKEDGMKYKEVAALLNISVKTVENQLIIALKKISAAIKDTAGSK
ncbi:RNA polymerase sigma-70 factor [Mucilaginibacter ximonensis]|uniref:RNA polymerase sigma-70 factor n=1 Tax=Mucilaginibacter ximonensis TaxID=538021 RepID=A0ABW5YD53_9SPHI